MTLFKKPCNNCKAMKTVKSFQTTQEFFAIHNEMKALLASERYEFQLRKAKR